MNRYFDIGEAIRFLRKTKARDKYGQVIKTNNFYIDAYSKGVVVSYNDKYTDSDKDDLVKIKITSGDESLVGKTAWVKSCDFEKIDKVY